METTKTPGLSRPRVVQLAAIILIGMALMDAIWGTSTGNYIFGVLGWPIVCGAGMCLLVRHKLAWVIGIGLALSFVAITSVDVMKTPIDEMSATMRTLRMLDCFLVLFIVSAVAMFFRYPYLDRRQNWFKPTGNRYLVESPVKINDGIETTTLDLSYTGARVHLPKESGIKSGDHVTLQFGDINEVVCKASVLSVDNKSFRVQFENNSPDVDELIRQWLSSQKLQKI